MGLKKGLQDRKVCQFYFGNNLANDSWELKCRYGKEFFVFKFLSFDKLENFFFDNFEVFSNYNLVTKVIGTHLIAWKKQGK